LLSCSSLKVYTIISLFTYCLHVVVFDPSLIFSKSADATVRKLSPHDGITTITTASDSQLEGKMTNYRTHSTEKSKPIEIGFSEHDKESTTEQIQLEELQKQLLDVLDKLAQQSSD
jgi:hypothetical protein